MPRRLAIVLSHPTQYYSPWFAQIARQPDVELHVFYLWDFGVTARQDPRFNQEIKWDIDLLSGYEHTFVKNVSASPGTHQASGLDNPEILHHLDTFDPQFVLLFGYRYKTHLRIIRAAPSRPWKLLFRGDSHLLGHPRVGLMKRFFLTLLFRKFDGILAVGRANRDYFRRFGVPEGRIHFAPHSVDGTRFENAVLPEERQQARTELGVSPHDQVILFSGKLHPDKAPRDLLQAFARLDRTDPWLIFAGDGVQRNELENEAKALRLNRVRFLPFANQSQMPLRYALADLFVLPSSGLYETWGLAVNEAMHVGVPCVVSDRVGCHPDLIAAGKTGWVFPAGNIADLATTLETALRAVEAPDTRHSLSVSIKARISGYTYAKTTLGLKEAMQSLEESSV